MTYALEISNLAKNEYIEIYSSYNVITARLGDRFENETDSIFSEIENKPFLFSRKFKNYREAFYKKFPYIIIYEVIETTVIVHSFLPTKKTVK